MRKSIPLANSNCIPQEIFYKYVVHLLVVHKNEL